MFKHFSIINIFIIIGLIVLVYLGYNKYIERNIKKVLEQEVNIVKESAEVEEAEQQKDNKAVILPTESSGDSQAPKEPLIETESLDKPVEPAKPTTKNGLYENKIYSYRITCPSDWPLKIRNEANASIGIIPPKNGMGSITIQISETGSEAEEAKAEAEKYAGLISISETTINLAGISGSKVIINNSVTKSKRVYILLEKYGFYYSIEYTEESADFVKQAEAAVQTFEFTK